MAQEWKDYNLAWNKSHYGGISKVRIPPNNIWKPDIFMYNRSIIHLLASIAAVSVAGRQTLCFIGCLYLNEHDVGYALTIITDTFISLFLVSHFNFCRAMRCISAAYAVMRCVSGCLSRSWVVSKRIKIFSKFFSPSGSHTILVFPYQTGCQYSDGNPPNGGVECKGGMKKSRFSTNIGLYLGTDAR